MSFTLAAGTATEPVKGELRLIFDELQHADAAADYLEEVTGGRARFGPARKRLEGGWIITGYLKLPEPEPP